MQLSSIKLHMMQSGVKALAHLLSRAGMDNLLGVYEGDPSTSADRDEAKKLDVVAVSVFVHMSGSERSLLCRHVPAPCASEQYCIIRQTACRY